jgi:hypothetical protein
MQLDAPFARLPLRLDSERLKAEVLQFEWFEWVPFRFQVGYGSIELVWSLGRSMDPAIAPYLPTPNLDRCPYIKQVLACFPGVHFGAQLRWLGPGAQVSRHWDPHFYAINRPRVHIPILTSDRATFVVGDKRIHMGEGEVWLFDRFSYHVADNEGESDRIHLTMDVTPDVEFCKLVARAHKPFTYWKTTSSDAAPELIPYAPDAHVRIRTERMGDGPGNSPAEVDLMVGELVGWMRRNRVQDEARARAVEQELDQFRIEWRCIWAEFGCTAEGWPSYLALGKATLARVRELEGAGPDALVGDDVPVWMRLRDYLYLGLLSSRGVRSVVPDVVVPDIDERFVVPDVLLRFAGPDDVEALVPRTNEFARLGQLELVLLAHLASHERLPDGADDDSGGDATRAAIQRLLELELLLPQRIAPRPAWTVQPADLGIGGEVPDSKPVMPDVAGSAEEVAVTSVVATTKLRLRGSAPHYARLRWRGYEGGMELLLLGPGTQTKLDVETLYSLVRFAEEMTPSELSEQLGGDLDDESLEAIRSLVRLGVLEPLDGAPRSIGAASAY